MSSEPIQVLHVDDNPDFVKLTERFIPRTHDDIVVDTETDPQQCLDRFEHEPQSIDCIVSDYDMPHLNGLEMLEIIREEYPDFPFILFTGKGSEEIASEAITKGVDDYMQKELGSDQYTVLANRIKQHVRRARTERALRNSEAKYRALVEQNIVGIYLIQGQEFVYVNPRLAEIFGYEREDLVGASPLKIVAERDKDIVAENLRKRLEGETDTIQYQLTGQDKTGVELEILVQGQRIDLNGEPTVAGVLLDLEEINTDQDNHSS